MIRGLDDKTRDQRKGWQNSERRGKVASPSVPDKNIRDSGEMARLFNQGKNIARNPIVYKTRSLRMMKILGIQDKVTK